VTQRVVVIAVAVVVAVAALVGVGRWEQHRAADTEMAGMRSVLAAIGGHINSKRLSGFRYGPPNCLAYHDRTMLLALQLCFDSEGRVIQSVDRRPDQPRYSSLEYEPSLSTIRFPPAEIDRLLQLAASGAG
jgi:hypothetical protein